MDLWKTSTSMFILFNTIRLWDVPLAIASFPPCVIDRWFNPKTNPKIILHSPSLSTLTRKMSVNTKFKDVLDTAIAEPNDEVNFSFRNNSVSINPYAFDA
jgi:hypothetical protein